jgi:RHS repeat-associated protein
LAATASDGDGSIASVQFFNSTALLATVTQPPYAYTWSNVAAGTYSLTARATDNRGAATTTQASLITKSPGVPKVYFVYVDQINTPREITNSAGELVWRADLTEPFGANLPNETPTGGGNFIYNLCFPGQYFDKETGLHYNYFRDYDPQIGRYVESDPIGLRGGINTYAYVGQNPLTFSDPDGLQAQAAGCAIGLPFGGPIGCGIGIGITTAATVIGVGVMMTGDTTKDRDCPLNNPCPPCRTVSGKVVPTGTIGYRPLDTPNRAYRRRISTKTFMPHERALGGKPLGRHKSLTLVACFGCMAVSPSWDRHLRKIWLFDA